MKPEMKLRQISPSVLIFGASIIILILLSYGWRLQVFDVFPFEYDEGIHLVLGKLWAAGYIPYQEIFVSYPPSFMWSLGIPWKIFHQVQALQWVMTTYSLAGVLAVVYLGTAYDSRLAGISAGIFLSFAPAYFIDSFAIMTEVPSISLAVVAIALAEKYRRSGGWVWSMLAGIALGFGLSLKILPYFAVPLIGAMVISRHVVWGKFNNRLHVSKWILSRDLALLTGAFFIAFLLPIFWFDFSAFYDQVVGMRLASREADLNPFDSNNDDILDFLFGNSGLTALALYGFIFVVAPKLSHYWVLVAWFMLTWVSMYFLVPLRPKHMPIFLPVMAIIAGFGVNHICLFLKQVTTEKLSARLAAMVLATIMILGLFIWNVPGVIAENNGQMLEITINQERLAAIDFINGITTPTDCVIADNPVFVHQTNRLPPPQLAETSQTRIDTGYLTLQDVIKAIQTYKCQVVAVVTPRFNQSLPGLSEWLAQNYLGLYAQSETFVYFAPKGQLAKTEHNMVPIQNGNFANVIQLQGAQLSQQLWQPGQKGFISLWWQLVLPIETRYIEQITLRNAATQEPAHQTTRMQLEGFFDPAQWRPNEPVRDTFWLALPADLPAGSYNIYLALCKQETNQCLPVNNQAQSELYLGSLTVQP